MQVNYTRIVRSHVMQNWNWKFTSGTICSSNGFVWVESRFQSLQQLLYDNKHDIVDIFWLNILLITIFLICYFFILHINTLKSKLLGLYFILESLKINSSKKSWNINYRKYYLLFFLSKFSFVLNWLTKSGKKEIRFLREFKWMFNCSTQSNNIIVANLKKA